MDETKPYKICKEISNYENCIKLDLNEFDLKHHPDLLKTLDNVLYKNKTITKWVENKVSIKLKLVFLLIKKLTKNLMIIVILIILTNLSL